jgi:hypothetical protein
MSNPRATAAAARTAGQEVPGRWLLAFLDRNLSKFSGRVRNVIGLTIVALLVIVVLHGTVAPTYVEGHLFIADSATEPKQLAKQYLLVRGNEQFLTNENGYWMLPMRGILPRKVHVQVHDPSRNLIDSFSFWGPVPVMNALWVSTYEVEVRTYLRAGEASRVRVAVTKAPTPLLNAVTSVATALNPMATVHAQPRAARWQVPYVKARLERLGDVACRDGGWCGTRGESRRLEGFAINLTERDGKVSVEYLCSFADDKPGRWLPEGAFCGAGGQSRSLEAFAVRLVGPDAGRFVVAYQAFRKDEGESAVFTNGQTTGTGRPVTAIRVWLDRR